MLFWPSDREAVAWIEADDARWAERARQAYDAEAARRDGAEPAEGPAP